MKSTTFDNNGLKDFSNADGMTAETNKAVMKGIIIGTLAGSALTLLVSVWLFGKQAKAA